MPKNIRNIIDARSNLHKIIDSIGWLFLDKLIRMGLTLLLMAWIARYLGPNQYGQLTYVLTFVGLFTIPASLGLYSIVVRDVIKEPNSENEILGTAFFLRVIGGGVAYLLSILTISLLKRGESQIITLVSILATTLLFQASSVIQWRFESRLEARYIVWPQNIIFLIFAIIKIYIIKQEFPLIYFIYLNVAEALLFSIALFIFYCWKINRILDWKIKINRAKVLLVSSMPIMMADILIMIQSKFDQILIGNIASTQQLGYYGAALSVAEAASFFAAIIWITLAPSITNAKILSKFLYRKRLLNFYRLNFLIFLVIALFIVALSDLIIKILYGPAYAEAAIMLALMSTRIFFAQMGMARGAFLVNEGMLKYSLYTILVGAAIGILLNLYLIPKYQAFGAIYASMVSNFITLFLLDIFYKPARNNLMLMLYGVKSFYRVLNINNLK